MRRRAKAEVPGFRQESQFTCMAASLAACLKAHGKDQTESDVNRVMGAGAMRGATWEDLTAAAQYFGMRSTLVVPSTVNQLRGWTDKGIPVIIAYNPEGRPWSHASVVFDVTGEGPDTKVHIMDPNIPDPDEHVRVMSKPDFYKVWGEPLGDRMIVRRPACAIEREITPEGKQVMASRSKTASTKVDSRGRTWGPRRGLEGPFRYRSGIVLYWDPREGHYLDPSTDRYLYDDREFLELTGEFWERKASASRVAARVLSAGMVEINEGTELVALKDLGVGFPVGSGRGHSGVLKRGSRIRVGYATNRGDVFARMIRGVVLMQEHDGKTMTPVPDAPFALREGHRSRHPYDFGVVDDLLWKVV